MQNSMHNYQSHEKTRALKPIHMIHSAPQLQDYFFIDKEKNVGGKYLHSVRSKPTYKSDSFSSMRRIPTRKTPEVDQDEENKTDNEESPPVDDSFFFDNLGIILDVKYGTDDVKSYILRVLDPNELRLLLNMENGKLEESPDGILFPKSTKKFKSLAYIWACFRDLVHLLPKLEKSGADVHYTEPTTGVNAVLAGAVSDSVACIEYLLKRGADVNVANSVNKYTPLHFAAFGNACQTANLLLNYGAKLSENSVNIDPVLHCAIRAQSVSMVRLLIERGVSVTSRNHVGETPLHVACVVQSSKCMQLLLNTAKVDVNAVDREGRTPLHSAIRNAHSSAQLIEILLEHGAVVNCRDGKGFTPLHVAALKELSKCADMLIWAGGDLSAKTRAGVSCLSIVQRQIPESLEVFRQKLDASINLKKPEANNKEFEMRLDFDVLFPTDDKCETSFINTFLHDHNKDLLSHPLIMAFLHRKWEKIRMFYLLKIFVYMFTVIFMTLYVLTVPAYNCYDSVVNGTYCENIRKRGFLFRKPVIESCWYILVIFTLFTIPRKIFGYMVYKSVRKYLSNIDNILDMIVFCSVFVISFVYTGKSYDWQNYIGAFAILCAWSNFMMMVGQLPTFGTYVAMFTHIQGEFAKLLLAYSGLLIGFTISFCVIFSEAPSFQNPFTGLIKVMAMMVGDVDFDDLLNKTLSNTQTSVTVSFFSQILFLLFLVFVTVILMNLLVGIAVHDIQGLRDHAGLTKLIRQTKLTLFIETSLYKGIIPRFVRKLFDCKLATHDRKYILVVKPLNPLEERLPKNVLEAAYEIAQRNTPLNSEEWMRLNKCLTWRKRQITHEIGITELHSVVQRLSAKIEDNEDAMNLMRKELEKSNKILEDILMKLN